MYLTFLALVSILMPPVAYCAIVLQQTTINDAWEDYKNYFNKDDYDSVTETLRKEAFRETLKHVILRNLQHDLDLYEYMAGLNAVSDFTPDEMHCSKHDQNANDIDESEEVFQPNDPDHAAAACMCGKVPCPDKLDWVASNKVNNVGEQKCGDCYAWAATFVLASVHAVAHKTAPQDLSVQESKDCSYNITRSNAFFQNKGCNGGSASVVYRGLINNTNGGSVLTATYDPYNYTNYGTLICNTARTTNPVVRVRNASFFFGTNTTLPNDDCRIIQQLKHGPVVASMCVSPDIHTLYAKTSANRPYADTQCTQSCQNYMAQQNKNVTSVNHAVMIAGYTPTAWLVQNSWGSNWASGGRAYFARTPHGSNRICNLGYRWYWPEL